MQCCVGTATEKGVLHTTRIACDPNQCRDHKASYIISTSQKRRSQPLPSSNKQGRLQLSTRQGQRHRCNCTRQRTTPGKPICKCHVNLPDRSTAPDGPSLRVSEPYVAQFRFSRNICKCWGMHFPRHGDICRVDKPPSPITMDISLDTQNLSGSYQTGVGGVARAQWWYLRTVVEACGLVATRTAGMETSGPVFRHVSNCALEAVER